MENFNYSAIGNRLTGAMPVVPSGNVATVRMRFIFSPDWNGLTKHAVFKKCGKSYDASIENGVMYMPAEIMKKPGAFDFGVVGYESDGETVVERISTNMVGGRVIDGAYNANAENGDAEDHPSDWEKLMEHLSDTSNPHKVKSEQLEEDPIFRGKATFFGDVDTVGGVSALRGEFGIAEVQNVDDTNDKAVPNLSTVRGMIPTLPTVDASMSDTSRNAVENRVIKAYVDSMTPEGIVDTEMSDTSTNPVENRVIKAYVDAMTPEGVVDTEMSDTSANPVENRVIKAYADAMTEDQLSYNRMNPSEVVQGYVTVAGREFPSSTSYKHTGFIQVEPGETIAAYRNATPVYMPFVTAYDENKAVLSDKGKQGSTNPEYFVPEGVKYVVISMLTANVTELTHIGVKGDVLYKPFEPTSRVPLGVPALRKSVKALEGAVALHAYLPKEICVAVGRTVELYNDLVLLEAAKYNINWTCDIGIAYGRKFSVSAKTAMIGNHALTLTVYDDALNIVLEKRATLRIVPAEITGNVNIVAIGDSLTNGKPWLSEVRTLSGNKIKYIGTRGTTAMPHEGRSGFRAEWYLTDRAYTFDSNYVGNPSVSGSSNPFWNGSKFSLAHYAATQTGYVPTPNAVQILLGTNDIKIDPTVNANAIKGIVDAVRDEYENMPIFVCNTIYRSRQDGYYSSGADGYVAVPEFQRDADIKVMNLQNRLAELFEDYEGVYIMPLSVTMDRDNDFGAVEVPVNPRSEKTTTIPNESVHPRTEGYMQMADVMFSTIAANL